MTDLSSIDHEDDLEHVQLEDVLQTDFAGLAGDGCSRIAEVRERGHRDWADE